MKSSPLKPSWLNSVQPSHLDVVYDVLGQRETKRDSARLESKHPPPIPQDQPKYTHTSFFRFFKLTNSASMPSHYSVAVAALPENTHYNRYMDIAPYDRTRVVVNYKQEELGERSDYLNASWVLEQFGHKWWIATQAPLPVTAHTFLSLFLQPNSSPPPKCLSSSRPRMSRLRTIVQLTQNYERGRCKAHAYFPDEVGKSLIVPRDGGGSTSALKVTLRGRRSISEARCVHTTIAITSITLPPSQVGLSDEDDEDNDSVKEGNYREEGEAITVQHLLYTAWPDHGVPDQEDRASLLSFLRLVDSTNRDVSLASRIDNQDPDPDPPIVVGCSAGVGRTGSFIALSSLLRRYGFLPPPASPTLNSALPRCPLGPLPRALGDDLVAQEIDSLREQRPGMVQRTEQILLIYEVLGAAFG